MVTKVALKDATVGFYELGGLEVPLFGEESFPSWRLWLELEANIES